MAGPPVREKCGEGFQKGGSVSTTATPLPAKEPALPPQLSIHKHGLFESDNTANVNFLKDTQIKTGPYFWSPFNLRAKFHFVLHNNKMNRFEVFLQSTFLSPDKAEQWGLLFKKGKPALLQSPVQHCHLGAEPSKPYP